MRPPPAALTPPAHRVRIIIVSELQRYVLQFQPVLAWQPRAAVVKMAELHGNQVIPSLKPLSISPHGCSLLSLCLHPLAATLDRTTGYAPGDTG